MQVMRLGVTVVLARLLSPHDFGLAAMVLVFSSVIFVFSDLALGTALVQRPTLTEADRSTVFWTSVVVGIVLTLLGVAASGPIADFYGEPEVQPLLAVLSLTFLITALSTTQIALLTREMKFRSLELRQVAGSVAGALIGLTVAARGYGAWAIIAQNLTIAIVAGALLWALSSWRPRMIYSIASLRSFGGFGAKVLGMRLLIYVNRNIDGLLIGRLLGASALGAYAIASSISLFPFRQIAGPVQEVLYPAFARMQDDRARIAALWIRINRLVGAITIPSLLGMMVVAPDFVRVVLGEKWNAAIPVIQALSWVGLLQSLQRLNMGILDALNRPQVTLWYSVVVVVSGVVALFAGLHWGLVGIAIAFAVASTLVEPFYWWLTARALGTSVRTFLRSLTGVVQVSVIMVVFMVLLRSLLIRADLPIPARLLITVAAGALIVIPLGMWRVPEVAQEVRQLRGRAIERHVPAPTGP